MVKLGLQISAQLENVTDLKLDGDDFRWYLKLKCNNCQWETPEFVYLTLLESYPLKGARGNASLVLKCKLCSRESSINILKESISSYTFDDCPKFKTIVAFDCRGMEPSAFDPRVGWSVKGLESNTKFEVDLSQDWSDYDENSNAPVSICELQYKFIKL